MSCKVCSSTESLHCKKCIKDIITPLKEKLNKLNQQNYEKKLKLEELMKKIPENKIKFLSNNKYSITQSKKLDKGK